MASEMLDPGNVGIAIKGTVWISQGVPCPMSVVMCYTEQLGGVRQGVTCVGRPPEWEKQVGCGKHSVLGVLSPLEHDEVVMMQRTLGASSDCEEPALKSPEGVRHRRKSFSSQAGLNGWMGTGWLFPSMPFGSMF